VEFGVEGLQDIFRCQATGNPLDLPEQIFATLQIFTRDCRQWGRHDCCGISLLSPSPVPSPVAKGARSLHFHLTLLPFSATTEGNAFDVLRSPR
jgi:hypothetical protein